MLQGLTELPSTWTRETYATVQTYHTCGCRDNPHQPKVPSLRSVLLQPTLKREYLSVFWQLGSFLFGMPARGPSRPLLVGFRVAALALGPPLHGGR